MVTFGSLVFDPICGCDCDHLAIVCLNARVTIVETIRHTFFHLEFFVRAKILLIVLLSLLVKSPSSMGKEVVVVCASNFRSAIKSWIEYRESQGYVVRVLESKPRASDVTANIRALGYGKAGFPNGIVIFGDCRLSRDNDLVDSNQFVPTNYVASPVSAAFGSTKTCPTDSSFADLDGDGKVDVPVGRIPVDRPDQVGMFVQRVKAYEKSRDFGAWRHTVDLTAGIGGFGLLVDGAIESVTRGIINSKLPRAMQTRVSYASPTSPFFPGFSEFSQTVIQRFNDGGLFWVYAGHGQVAELDRVPASANGRPIIDRNSVRNLKRPAERAPIALMLACFTGAYDARDDCLAERMLFEPGGPIGVIAGTRVTLPYGNGVIATSLSRAWFEFQPETLGEAWFRTVQLVGDDPKKGAGAPSMLDAMAAMMSPTAAKLPEERREHTFLYNLIGDPLLRLKHPGAIELKAPISVEPGDQIVVEGISPHEGALTLEIHRHGEPTRDQLANLSNAERYAVANRSKLRELTRQIAPGNFKVPVGAAPADLKSIIVVARLASEDRYSLGSDRVLIRKITRPE